MTTTLATPASFDIGRVLSRLFGVIGRNFVTFLLLSLLLAGIPSTIVVVGPRLLIGAGGAQNAALAAASGLILLVGLLVNAVANAVLQGAVIHGTVTDLAGTRPSFGDCLNTGLRFLLPLILIGIISAVAIGLGLLLLIVPGILLALAWSVAAPARVMEPLTVFGAYERSRSLSQNNRAAIFAVFVIVAVLGGVIQLVVGAFFAIAAVMAATNGPSATEPLLIVQAIGNLISQTVTAMIGAASAASVYYELRVVKEGVGAEQLAAVFD